MCERMLRKVWFGKGSDGVSHGKSYRKSIPGRGKGNADAESVGRAGVSVAGEKWEESSGQDEGVAGELWPLEGLWLLREVGSQWRDLGVRRLNFVLLC